MKLVWNELECGWECSECGAIYGEDEVARMFQFDTQIPKHFIDSYCMDCGVRFEEAVKE